MGLVQFSLGEYCWCLGQCASIPIHAEVYKKIGGGYCRPNDIPNNVIPVSLPLGKRCCCEKPNIQFLKVSQTKAKTLIKPATELKMVKEETSIRRGPNEQIP